MSESLAAFGGESEQSQITAVVSTEPATVTLIDGRSGAGKTTLAQRLAVEIGADVLSLDSLYPGWDGLAAGSNAVAEALERGEYQRYDWVRGEFERERISLDRARPLIIEGCGVITHANLHAARRWAERGIVNQSAGERGDGGDKTDSSDTSDDSNSNGSDDAVAGGLEAEARVRSIWLDAPEAERRTRALERDGDTFAPHWPRWAAQEDAHFGRHKPWQLAGETVTRTESLGERGSLIESESVAQAKPVAENE